MCACVKNKEIAQIVCGINDETIEQKKELTDIKTSYDSIKTLKFQILYLKHPRLSAEKQHFFSFIKPLFEKANMIFVSENIMLLYGNK